MYQKLIWKDHQAEHPRTYTLVTNEDGTVTLTPAPGEIYQQGTAMNAAHFGNAETGISDAHLFASLFMQFFLNFRRWVSGLLAVTVRVTAQTLETAEQAQARANILAQEKITAPGLLKGDGSGGVIPGVPDTDYAPAAIEVSATLLAASWSGTEAPYTQTVSISGMTTAKKAIAGLPATATSAQYLAALSALLHVTAQGTGAITVTAEGDAPEVDIPVLIQMIGG